jgi:hypothetical protein
VKEKILNEGNQKHNFVSSSGSGTVINYGSGSGSDFLTSYGSGSSSTRQIVTVPTVPVPQHCIWKNKRNHKNKRWNLFVSDESSVLYLDSMNPVLLLNERNAIYLFLDLYEGLSSYMISFLPLPSWIRIRILNTGGKYPDCVRSHPVQQEGDGGGLLLREQGDPVGRPLGKPV